MSSEMHLSTSFQPQESSSMSLILQWRKTVLIALSSEFLDIRLHDLISSILQVYFPQQDSRFNQEIDKKTGYHTRSILCMPILDHYHGEVQYDSNLQNLGLDESRVLKSGFWGVVVDDPREFGVMFLQCINSYKI